jgi:hypothetical protein
MQYLRLYKMEYCFSLQVASSLTALDQNTMPAFDQTKYCFNLQVASQPHVTTQTAMPVFA